MIAWPMDNTDYTAEAIGAFAGTRNDPISAVYEKRRTEIYNWKCDSLCL